MKLIFIYKSRRQFDEKKVETLFHEKEEKNISIK